MARVTQAMVYRALDNRAVNGYATHHARAVAIDLLTYDADLEAEATEENIYAIEPHVRSWMERRANHRAAELRDMQKRGF